MTGSVECLLPASLMMIWVVRGFIEADPQQRPVWSFVDKFFPYRHPGGLFLSGSRTITELSGNKLGPEPE